MKFLDYMPQSGHYTNPTSISLTTGSDIGIEIGQEEDRRGWLIAYISSTFLNGWINYVKPIKAFVIHRYFEGGQAALAEKVRLFNTESNFHSDLGAIGDDILLLATDQVGDYWYFWFDNDVSDCQIGRFNTDSKTVVDDFVEYVKLAANDMKDYHTDEPAHFELNVKKICGWVKF